jgi:hypothetical protein
MAKKGVVVFDGEDMFINPKKAIYSKTRGEARNASFMSARGDDGPAEEESPGGDGPMGKERIMREGTSGGGAQAPSAPPTLAPTIVDEPITQQIQAETQRRTAIEPDTITIKGPIAEIPTIVVPPILPPNYVAPTPDLPTRPTPPGRTDPVSGIRYKGDEPEPGATPIFTIDDGSPAKPVIDTPRYVAPVPDLPSVPAAPVPPAAIVIPDPMGGGGSPLLGKDPEIPRPDCPTGFIFNADTGRCVPTKKTIDEEIKKIDTSSTTTTTTKKAEDKKDDILTPATTSSTTTTTTKAADKKDEETTTTSTTTTTTTKKSKNCNPPIYAAPKFYKWVDKGNCTFELAVDEKQVPNPSPAPTLPATPGQPIINLTLPTGGLGTLPTTSTIVQTTTLAKPTGSGGGGGGGTPFPEEPAPIVEAPKKNYFWWYVGGALALYLILKRKKTQ